MFFFAKFGPPILQKPPLKLATLFVTLNSMRDSDTDFFSSLVFLQIWLVYLCCSGFKKSDEKLATVGYMGSKNPLSPIPDPRETNLIVGDIYETPQQSLSQLYLRGSQGDSRLKCCFWEVRFEVLGWFQEFFHEHVLLCNYWVVDRLPS